jgi:hypothetical protein
MKCEDLEELLSAYADGELAGAQRDFVEEHLNDCADCQSRLAEYRKTGERLLSLRVTPSIPDIKEATMLRIKMVDIPIKLRRWLRPAFVATPVIIALIIILSLYLTGTFSSLPGTLDKAYAAMEKLESYRYTKDEYIQLYETDEPVHSYHVEFEYSAPDRYHLIIQTTEDSIYQDAIPTEDIVIGDQIYTNQSDPYLKNKEYYEQLTPTNEKTLGVLNTLTRIESMAEENIDGTDCYHYVGEVDIDKYLVWIRPSLQQQHERLTKNLPGTIRDFDEYFKRWEDMIRGKKMTHELWIGKDDYLIRQWRITSQAIPDTKTESSSNINISHLKYYDLNEEIIIEPPLNESGELLDGWVVYTLEE